MPKCGDSRILNDRSLSYLPKYAIVYLYIYFFLKKHHHCQSSGSWFDLESFQCIYLFFFSFCNSFTIFSLSIAHTFVFIPPFTFTFLTDNLSMCPNFFHPQDKTKKKKYVLYEDFQSGTAYESVNYYCKQLNDIWTFMNNSGRFNKSLIKRGKKINKNSNNGNDEKNYIMTIMIHPISNFFLKKKNLEF